MTIGNDQSIKAHVDIKGGFWRILNTTLISSQLMNFNLDFKSTLKSRLVSREQFLHILKTTLISRQLKLSPVNNIHDVSLVSSEEGVNIIILSDSLEQLGCIFLCFFQINELLQEVTQFQEEQSKALLRQVHPSDSREKAHLYSQVIFWYWRPSETAAWLAQLVERQSAEREVEGSSPRPDQHSGS